MKSVLSKQVWTFHITACKAQCFILEISTNIRNVGIRIVKVIVYYCTLLYIMQLNSYCKRKQIICSRQSGFREEHSI